MAHDAIVRTTTITWDAIKYAPTREALHALVREECNLLTCDVWKQADNLWHALHDPEPEAT
jgi:hypothetical protein